MTFERALKLFAPVALMHAFMSDMGQLPEWADFSIGSVMLAGLFYYLVFWALGMIFLPVIGVLFGRD